MNDALAPSGPAVAVVVARQGRLPAGADETVAEAGGPVVVVGTGVGQAAGGLPSATRIWTAELEAGPGQMAVRLASSLAGAALVLLPASADGRDLGPRLAAAMHRPLLAGAVRASVEQVTGTPDDTNGTLRIHADLLRVDGRVVVPVDCAGSAVVTLLSSGRPTAPARASSPPATLVLDGGPNSLSDWRPAGIPDPEILALIEPDPATMDLADAVRVLGGGAGLVPRGASEAQARALFGLLADVAAKLGASMGATRVVTDAGWTGTERQIGTTGVAIDPELYVAFGVSGASQHIAGLGAPRHTVSVNTDPSCPMTAMADLGLVTDATALLLRMAERLAVSTPPELEELTVPPELEEFRA